MKCSLLAAGAVLNRHQPLPQFGRDQRLVPALDQLAVPLRDARTWWNPIRELGDAADN